MHKFIDKLLQTRSFISMKNRLSLEVMAIIVLVAMILSGCLGGRPVTDLQTVAMVQRGDLEVKVTADGYIEMPDAVNLYFDTTMFNPPYSARIKKIYVQKGDTVKAGALLAKLDDTTQKLSVEAAQYALELAINNVVQTVCCGVTRVPSFYSDAVALTRYEYAINEIKQALKYLNEERYEDAAEQTALAKYDLDATRTYYSSSEFHNLRAELDEFGREIRSSSDAELAVERITSEINNLVILQDQMQSGQYGKAKESLDLLLTLMSDTHTVVKRISHLPGNYIYPDTCTTFTLINEVLESLSELQKLAEQPDYDAIKFAETLSKAQHDLELSNKVLDENISTFRQGLNFKALRDYNINIQTAIVNLEKAKQALLKTELFAPFDGQIVDLNLQAGDMITQRYSTTGLPIDSYVMRIVNTRSVRMSAIMDEIDILKVNKGQTATIYIDALPGKQFKGRISFISSFGTLQTGVANYKVEIALDPEDSLYLTGGLTATAEISVDKHDNVLIVPNNAIKSENGSYFVQVVRNEKTWEIEQRPVTIGIQSRANTEIISGLKEGEIVLLDISKPPAKSLNPGKMSLPADR